MSRKYFRGGLPGDEPVVSDPRIQHVTCMKLTAWAKAVKIFLCINTRSSTMHRLSVCISLGHDHLLHVTSY